MNTGHMDGEHRGRHCEDQVSAVVAALNARRLHRWAHAVEIEAERQRDQAGLDGETDGIGVGPGQ